jgi:hypothetical protein
MSDPKKRLTLDEILDEISEVARNGEGADKFRALKMLRDQETGGIALPAPLNDEDRIEQASMVLESLGPIGAQFAYRRAFPMAKRPVQHSAPRVLMSDLMVDESVLPHNLKEFNRMFPELKKHGFPPTYPQHSGMAKKREWCIKQARKILLDRKQAGLDAAAINAKEDDEPGSPADLPTA